MDPGTVGQFTGRKNNSREIYEHDLIECNGVLCEVVYNDKTGSFVLLEILTQNLGNRPIGQMIDMFGIKHIGNVYDNPELLKEGSDEEQNPKENTEASGTVQTT